MAGKYKMEFLQEKMRDKREERDVTESFGKPEAYFFHILLIYYYCIIFICLSLFAVLFFTTASEALLSSHLPGCRQISAKPAGKNSLNIFSKTRTFLKLFFILTVQTKLQKNTFNKRR